LKPPHHQPFSGARHFDGRRFYDEDVGPGEPAPFDPSTRRKFSYVSKRNDQGWWEVRVRQFARKVEIGYPICGPTDYEEILGDALEHGWLVATRHYWCEDIAEKFDQTGVRFRRGQEDRVFVPPGSDKFTALQLLNNVENGLYFLVDREPTDQEMVALDDVRDWTREPVMRLLDLMPSVRVIFEAWGGEFYRDREHARRWAEYVFPFGGERPGIFDIDIDDHSARYEMTGWGDDGTVTMVDQDQTRQVYAEIVDGAWSEPVVTDLTKLPDRGLAELFHGRDGSE
jgi:hypothetical protein